MTNDIRTTPTDAAKSDGIDTSSCSVLLVDDNEQNVELLLAYLEELRCELRTAGDGQAALDEVAKKKPDLILMDVMMPRMSGFQACKRIKSDPATRDIPIVMVTALNEVSDVERAVDSGADDFLTKPVNRVELLARTRSLLKVSVLQRQLAQTMSDIRKMSQNPRQGP